MAVKSGKLDKQITIIISIFIVVLIGVLVLLYFVAQKDKALQGADQAIKLSAQGGFECEYAEAQKLYAFGEGILKVTNERIAYLTLSGNEVFSQTVSYSNPKCYINGDKAVVFDMDGYSFVFLSTESVIYEKPTSNKIKSAIISNSSLCAIITDCPSAYGEVVVYSESGTPVSQWTSYNSGYPLSVAFNEDSSFFAISTVSTSGASVQPYIRIFGLNQTDAGIQSYDYAVYTVDESDIFSTVMYVQGELFTFSSRAIYTVYNDEIVMVGEELGAINYATALNDVFFVIYSDGVDQMNHIRVLNSNGETVYDSVVGSDVNAIAHTDSLYALSIDNRIFVFDRNGQIVSDMLVDEDILRIGFIGNNKLVVVSTSGVHTIDYN